MSGFPFKKPFDMFDFAFQPSIVKKQIDELRTMRFVQNAKNLMIVISGDIRILQRELFKWTRSEKVACTQISRLNC